MKYLSIASGIGAFELALKEHEAIGYSEIDKKAISVYERHFNHKNYGDLTKIDFKKLPDFDLVVGGLPCQPHSIAGKRKGTEDDRDLFAVFNELLREKRPDNFIIENVPGFLKSLHLFKYKWMAMGYDVTVYTVTASDWGVPQKRKRIFMCGRYGEGREPIGVVLVPPAPIHCPSVKDIAEDEVDEKYYLSEEQLKKIDWDTSFTKVLGDGDIARTLTTVNVGNQNRRGNLLQTEIGMRRLTPLEGERVMGLPDDWTKYDKDGNELSDNARYKLIDNSVVPACVEAVLSIL